MSEHLEDPSRRTDAVRWLHLSDLHLGCRGREIWWQAHHELSAAIRDGVRRLGAPDLVLFTGDLSFSGSKKEFRLVDKFLDDLLGWIRDAGAAVDPVVVPVPGNHDVLRQQGMDAFRYLVLDKYDRGNDDEDVRALRTALWDDRDASFLAPLFEPYQAWLKRRILPQRKRTGVRIDTSYFPGDLTVEIDLPGRSPLLVVGLNSTWMQYKAGDDFDGRLELPAAQFHAALDPGAKGSPLSRLDGRRALLLMHQPESWLSVRASSDFRQLVYTPHRFAACLHGHLHAPRARVISEAGGAPRAYFQAPSLFGLERYGTKDEERLIGFAWGRMTADGEVRVWPLRRVVRGDDSAEFDRDPSFHCDAEGAIALRSAGAVEPATARPCEAPAEIEPDIEGYVAWAGERYRGLNLIGVGGDDVRLDLEEVYVPLHIAWRAVPMEIEPDATGKHGGAAREHGPLEIELDEIFTTPRAAGRHVLILGDPGSGKTTVLRKLHQQVLKEPRSLGLEPGTLPVMLPLRRLREDDLGRPLSEALGRELHQLSDGEVAAELGERLWRRGRLLLLLDGLDEIADDDHRARLCHELDWQFAEAAGREVRAVVSCRFTGYGDGVRLDEGFLPLEIRPLDAEQCRRLVRSWFREAPRALPGYPERKAREAAERLESALDGTEYGSQRLKVLVGSPLLLTLLCVVVLRGGEMPKQRVAFYDQCLRVLLSQWGRSKRAPGESWEPPLDVETTLAVLRSLAWELHRRERRDDLALPELLLHLEEGLARLGKEVPAFQVWKWLHREAGVLEEFAPRHYGFLHLGVQEYLTALHVASQGDRLLGELCERCEDPWWQEVLLLTVGLPGRQVFAPLMERLLASPLLLERTDLVRACLDEAPEADLEPLLAWLGPGREPARQAAVLRVIRDRSDPRLEARVDELAESATETVRALAGQIRDEIRRPTRGSELFEVVVVHHPEDAEAATELARRLDYRGLRVLRMAEDVSDRELEQILAGVPRVAVAVGQREPWADSGLLGWLKLFARRQCSLVPVLLPGGREHPASPDDLVLEQWLELGDGMSGLERLAVPLTVPTDVPAKPGQAFTEPLTETRFLWIPGGKFRMGGDRHDDERPIHRVRISPFWLAETTVTNRQYAIFLDQTGHQEPGVWRDRRFSAPEQPVVAVSWHDARAFCRWLAEASGVSVNLPTEAQWEFAARGPDGREYPWGAEEPDSTRACFEQDWEKGKPASVGSCPEGRGPFGNLDLAGNVWEWCQDAWDEKAYKERSGKQTVDPLVESDGDPQRVLRGGGWRNPAESLRAACRLGRPATDRYGGVGFRLAAAPPSLES